MIEKKRTGKATPEEALRKWQHDKLTAMQTLAAESAANDAKRRACGHFVLQSRVPFEFDNRAHIGSRRTISGVLLHKCGGTFDPERNRKFYMLPAEQCETAAAKANDPRVREDWLKLAEGYRKLTEHP